MISISLNNLLRSDAWAIDALYALRATGKINQCVIDDFIDTGCSDLIDVLSMVWQLPDCYELLKDSNKFNLAKLVSSDHLDTVIYTMRLFPSHMKMWCKFAIWSANQVSHLMSNSLGTNALNAASRYVDGFCSALDRDGASSLFSVSRNDGVFLSYEHAASVAVYDAIYASKLLGMGESVSHSLSDTVKRVVDAVIYVDESFSGKASVKLTEIIHNGEWIE